MRINKLPPRKRDRGNPISFREIGELVGRNSSYVWRCWVGQARPGRALARELKKLGWIRPEV